MDRTRARTFSPNVHPRKTSASKGNIRDVESALHQHPQQISRILQPSLKPPIFKLPEFILNHWSNKED